MTSDPEGNRLDFNLSETKGRSKTRDNHVNSAANENSPNSSFVSGNAKLGALGFDDKKEDEWEKLSRISRRTAQNKKPLNLESIDNKIKTLHNLHIDIKQSKNNGNARLTLDSNKDMTHTNFLDQQVPLSERNQADTDSASVSAQP